MFRRCVSLFAIVGFLASQLATMPHVHAGSTPEERREHDATPHFHVEHAHEHGHHHGSHRHSHGSDQRTDCVGLISDAPPLDGIAQDKLVEHDSTAFYVGDLPAVATCHSQCCDATTLFAVIPVLIDFGQTHAPTRPAFSWDSPDEVRDSSDRYLTLRNLRI